MTEREKLLKHIEKLERKTLILILKKIVTDSRIDEHNLAKIIIHKDEE